MPRRNDKPHPVTIELRRIEQNGRRQATLCSLCLTAKNISVLSTSVLYSSILLAKTSDDNRIMHRLSYLLRTVVENPQLGLYIVTIVCGGARYIHPWFNRLKWPLTSRISPLDMGVLLEDLQERASTFWSHFNLVPRPGVCAIAVLVAFAPNISCLRLNALTKREYVLLKFLGMLGTEALDISAGNFHGLHKLQSLSLSFRADDFEQSWKILGQRPPGEPSQEEGEDHHVLSRLITSCQRLPMLQELTLSGAFAEYPGFQEEQISGTFPKLKSLFLGMPSTAVRQYIGIVSGCPSLHRFGLASTGTQSDEAELPDKIEDLVTALHSSTFICHG